VWLARSSTQVSQAPGGKTSISLSWDETPAAVKSDEIVDAGADENDEAEQYDADVPTGYKANQLKGTTSSIFSGAGTPSAPVAVRPSKTQQSSIAFGESAPPSTTSRTSKLTQSSIEFGGAQPANAHPRITPTNQSHVFGNQAPPPSAHSPKMTNKSLVSTISLASDVPSVPTTSRNVRQAPGGNTSIFLG